MIKHKMKDIGADCKYKIRSLNPISTDNPKTQNARIERFCNDVAGEFFTSFAAISA